MLTRIASFCNPLQLVEVRLRPVGGGGARGFSLLSKREPEVW